MKQILILTIGAPGSGKSTLANILAKKYDAVIRSTDDEFIDGNGKYIFDPEKLRRNHLKNQQNVETDLIFGKNVIVDNTNTTFGEIEPYLSFAKSVGAEVLIVEPETSWKHDLDELFKRNTHNVPKNSIEKMLNRIKNIEDVRKEAQSYMKRVDAKLESEDISVLNSFMKEFLGCLPHVYSNGNNGIIVLNYTYELLNYLLLQKTIAFR